MARRVLVVAAHPDDEVLGAGGAICRHRSQTDEVFVALLGEGVTSRFATREEGLSSGAEDLKRLKQEIEAAHAVLGISDTFLYAFPDNRFDTVPLLDIVKAVEEVKKKVEPEIIYTHHPGDLNVDHGITFRAVLTACRPAPQETTRRILAFEVASSTEWSDAAPADVFTPNVFVEIAPFLETKVQALTEYGSEMRAFPHPRSVEAVRLSARLWGVRSGLQAAEAFVLTRERIGAGA